jgi:hypothetical protein
MKCKHLMVVFGLFFAFNHVAQSAESDAYVKAFEQIVQAEATEFVDMKDVLSMEFTNGRKVFSTKISLPDTKSCTVNEHEDGSRSLSCLADTDMTKEDALTLFNSEKLKASTAAASDKMKGEEGAINNETPGFYIFSNGKECVILTVRKKGTEDSYSVNYLFQLYDELFKKS